MSVQKRNRTKTILNSVTIFWTEFKYMYMIWHCFLKHVWYKLQTLVRMITPCITKYFRTRNYRILYAYYSIQLCFLLSYGDNKWIKRYRDPRLVDPWPLCHSSLIVCLYLVETRTFSVLKFPHKTVCGIN